MSISNLKKALDQIKQRRSSVFAFSHADPTAPSRASATLKNVGEVRDVMFRWNPISTSKSSTGRIVMYGAEVEVTFVLGHDSHGHAEVTVNGCSGFLPTDATDTAHGGNVWGIEAEQPANQRMVMRGARSVASFGEDPAGELYLVEHRSGRILRVIVPE